MSTTDQTATDIRPFHVDTPEAELVGLRDRVAATRWPSKELVEDRSQGVQLATLQELARYWTTDYDDGRVESRLNALPQFTTEIDGVEIHFIHVRSQHEDAMPLIMTHGWPGSAIELLETVGPPTDPTAHGRTPGGRFHLLRPPAPRPDGVRRNRRGRIPPRPAVRPRLRLLRRAHRSRLGPRPRRASLGAADAALRLYALRRSGRRRRRRHHRRDGPPSTRGSARHPPQRAHRRSR